MIYLDHNATSPLRARARNAMTAVLEEFGNASSVHAAGRRARAHIENAREKVARLAGAAPSSIVFTGGGSEANALALRGAVAGALAGNNRIMRLFVSAIEHESVRANARMLVGTAPGLRLSEIPVTKDGTVDLNAFRRLLMRDKGRALVSVMAANNETGVIQPLHAILDLLRRECDGDALLHIDATQFVGRVPVSFAALECDYLTFSAHKLGGPQGVGALVVRDGAPLVPLSAGAQEMGRRGGTENVAAIVGFAAAAEEVAGNVTEMNRLGRLRDGFEKQLNALVSNAVVFGRDAERIPNTSNFAIPGLSAETALIALDLDGIALSSGAACSSGKVGASHVLAAMGIDENLARCGLRLSLGPSNSEADIDSVPDALHRLLERRKQLEAAAA